MTNARMLSASLWRLLPAVVILLSGAAFAQDTSRPYQSALRPHALMVTGGSPESADVARQALSLVFTTLNIPVTYIDDPKLIEADALMPFDLVVVSGSIQLSTDQEQALLNFVQNGGGFLGLHNAADGPRGGPYERLLGGSLARQPGPYNVWIHLTDAGRQSPILAGIQDFEVLNEEQNFLNYHIDPQTPGRGGQPAVTAPGGQGSGARGAPAGQSAAGRAGGAAPRSRPSPFWVSGRHVLMSGYAGDNSNDPERAALANNGVTNVIAGWWNTIGRGRVVYLSPGYTAPVMNHPMMQRLYENSIRWLLTKLD